MSIFKRFGVGTALALAFVATAWNSALAVDPPTADLQLWLKADVDVYNTLSLPAANNDRITSWLDQSGQGNDGVPTSADWRPTYKTSYVNGQPAVNFALGPGGLQWTRIEVGTPLLTGTTDFAIIAVIRITGGGEHVIGANYGTGVANAGGLELYVYLNKLYLFKGTAGSVISTDPINDNTWYIVEAERSGTTFRTRINNIDQGTLTSASAITTTLDWSIGNAPNYSVAFNGDIPEVLVYTDNLATFPRWDALGYLSQKYDIAVTGIPEPAAGIMLLMGSAVLLSRKRKKD